MLRTFSGTALSLLAVSFTVVFLVVFPIAAIGGDAPQVERALETGTTTFARVSSDEMDRPDALQLAVVTYGSARFTVDLISAVHIGDKAYYAELNDRFKNYDALLYELVAPEGREVPSKESRRKGFVSHSQVAMKSALGLEFQLDEIDYDQPNFIHADLSPSEFRQSMVDRDESLYVYFWRVVHASIDEYAKDPLALNDWRMMMALMNAEQDDTFKTLIAYELTDVNKVNDILGGGSGGSAIVNARNEYAIEVLRQQLAAGARRIGIFYGVAHMPDFEQRLVNELGLTRRRIDWVDAWQLRAD